MYDDIVNKYKKSYESDFDRQDDSDNNNNYLKDSKEMDYNYENSDENKQTKDYDKYNDFDNLERQMFSENNKRDLKGENLYNMKGNKLKDFDYEKESKTLEKLNKIAEKKLTKKPSFLNIKPSTVATAKAKSALGVQKHANKPSLVSNNKEKKPGKALEKNLYSIENSEILAEIYKNEQEEFEAELGKRHNSNTKENKLKNDNNNHNDNNDLSDLDEIDREEMENEFEYVKSLNEIKEKNKKIEALNKYQSSKIETLQNDLENALNEIKTKDLEIECLKSSGKTPSQENRKTLNQINALSLQLDKYKALLSDKKTEISGLIEKISEQLKIIDQSAVAERKHKQEVSNKDKQIARLIEEIDRLSHSAANQRNQGNVASAKDFEKLASENKKLEKQKNDIYAAFKKSLKLCSILKRQKVHLENARLLAFTEEEFKQILEQNNKN